MTHLKVEEISRFAEGNVDKSEHERFLAHIAQCEDCRKAYSATVKFVESERAQKKRLRLPGLPKIDIPHFLHSIGNAFANKRLNAVFTAITVVIIGALLFNTFSNQTAYKQQKIIQNNDSQFDYSAFDAIYPVKISAVRAGIFVEDLFIILHNSDKKNLAKTLNLLKLELKNIFGEESHSLLPAQDKVKIEDIKKIIQAITDRTDKSLAEVFLFGRFVEKTIFNSLEKKRAEKDEVEKFLRIAEENDLHWDVIENLKRINNIPTINEYKNVWLDIREAFQYSDYMKTKGANHPSVEWAQKVFERVKAAADKAEAHNVRLCIINARIKLYVIALPDGRIIINPETLYICYSGVGKEMGDSRLAFILGHELAHLADKDFSHRGSLLTWEKKLYGNQTSPSPEKNGEHKQKELKADELGVLYAAMAGYDISILFGKQDNFFNHWESQIGRENVHRSSKGYPSLDERVTAIRARLRAVYDKVELFRAGILFLQMGNVADAKDAFNQFKQYYPAREVYNNIGAIYLSTAQALFSKKYREEYLRFRLYTAIDYSTSAGDIRGEPKEKIRKHLDEAITYFNKAVRRDKADRSSRYNLSAALLLRKKYAEALKVCNSILDEYPDDVHALNNKAVALYYSNEKSDEIVREAIGLLERAYQLQPGNVEVLYNLGSLKQDIRKSLWERYLELPTVPRDIFYENVYTELYGNPPPESETVEIPELPTGIKIGMAIDSLEKEWGKEKTETFSLHPLPYQVLVKGTIRVVAEEIDVVVIKKNNVHIVEKELLKKKKIETVLEKIGPPQQVVRHNQGNFYVYKNQNFSIKEINGKAHSYIWFE